MTFTVLGLLIIESLKNGSQERRHVLSCYGFLFVFIILASFSSIRDGVGCDYDSYVNHIVKIQSGLPNYMEPGFQFLVRFLADYNDNPRIVIIVIGVLTCFFYLKSIWDQSSDKVMSVFLFLSWGLYFLAFNTVRNYFALAIVFYAIKHLLSNKNFLFILWVVIASFFHMSAIICIPLYYLGKKITLRKGYIPIIIGVIIILLLLQVPIRSLSFSIYPSYEGSDYDTGRISYFNILKAIFIIGLCLKFKQSVYNDPLCRFYFNLNVFALILYIGVYWLPEISRIGFYMNMTVIFLIPRLLKNIDSRKLRRQLSSIVVGVSLIIFILLLFQFSSETTRLLPYKTWLFDGRFDI